MKNGFSFLIPHFMVRALLVVAACELQSGITSAATSSSTNYSIVADSVDACGAPASSSNYSTQASVGGISSLTTVAAPAELNKSGFLGQLYQVTGVVLNGKFINNSTTQQLSANQTLDDGTVLILTGATGGSWSIAAGQLPAGLTLDPSSGIISGSAPGVNAYSFTLLVTDGLGHSAQQTYAVLSFALWAAQYPSLSNPSPTATPENDGVDNQLKYLFDLDPTKPINFADRAALPSLGVDASSNPGSQYLSLTYRQYQSLVGMTVTVQTSTDLQNWTTVNPPDLSQQVGTDPKTGDPILEVGVIISPGTPKQFIRLHVTQP